MYFPRARNPFILNYPSTAQRLRLTMDCLVLVVVSATGLPPAQLSKRLTPLAAHLLPPQYEYCTLVFLLSLRSML